MCMNARKKAKIHPNTQGQHKAFAPFKPYFVWYVGCCTEGIKCDYYQKTGLKMAPFNATDLSCVSACVAADLTDFLLLLALQSQQSYWRMSWVLS